MIYIYEPYASGDIHFEFNKALLLAILTFEDDIYYFGDKRQISYFKENEKLNKINYYELPIPDFDKNNKKLYKVIREFKNLLYVKKKIKNNGTLLITNGLPQTLIFSRIIFPKSRKLNFIMHGQLAYLEKKLKPMNMNYYLEKALLHLSKTTKLIVLGNSIKNNVCRIMPQIKDKLYSIEHPYIPKELIKSKKIENLNNIKIGTIGVGSKAKGILDLNTIQEYLDNKEIKNVTLYHIGKTTKEIRNELNSKIILPFKTDSLIPKEDYLNEIIKLDFILFLIPVDSYRYTASGSLFEAFSLGIPLICLRNDYFGYIFDSIKMNVGYCDTSLEMLMNYITNIANITPNEYSIMSKNCKMALKLFSAEKVGEQIKKIIY